jgi:NAD(P)-dependent dehydrogenase (short-subunit alcohol dehydrogenase family)
VVTGAARGIGRAYAEAMAEAGAAVACADIDGHGADQTAAGLRLRGVRAIGIRADVSRESDVEAMLSKTVSELGRVDIAFCNAGIAGGGKPFPEASLNEWQDDLAVNLTGVWLTARAAARVMIRQGTGGRIISTASIYGLVASFEPTSGAYQAAKGAIVNLTRDLAVTLASHGINVTAIAPGYFRTQLGSGRLLSPVDEAARDFEREVVRRTPLGRVGDVADLKGIAVFLASDASAYLTGQTVAVDGGWLAL